MTNDEGREEDQVLRWVAGSPPAFDVEREKRRLSLDGKSWKMAEERLKLGAGGTYSELARAGEFGRWWPSAIGGQRSGIRRFRLQLPPQEWERPWEGMIAALDPPRWNQVSIVRQSASDTSPVHPSKLESALSVLCIQGAPTLAGDTLDLDAELRALKSAYAALDFAVRQAVAPPIAVKGRFHDLGSALLEYRPSVLWYSGHARDNPPGLLLDDGRWITPEDLVGILRAAKANGGRTALYVVLWACRTGSAPLFAEPTPAPAFVDALAAEGVAALLVSQAPLGDDVARRVAAEVFTALASGLPLDHGVTRARADLMRLADEKGTLLTELDWMCPVVWAKGYPPPALSWSDRREVGARRQGLARKLLPARLLRLAEPAPAVKPWPDEPRVWVMSAAPGAEGPRIEWARRVLALQQRTTRTVLWFDFSTAAREPATAVSQLYDWAKRALEAVEADDDPTDVLRTAAAQVDGGKDHEGGWRALCSSEWFLLAILEPPDQSVKWLWDGLRSGKAQAIVLADDYPDERAEEAWIVETLVDEPDILMKSRSLAALALLGCPAARVDIKAAIGEAIDDWIQSGVIVETSAGCVMPAGMGQKVVTTLTPEECIEGHGLAYDFLAGDIAKRKLAERDREDILLARWRHAQLAKFADGFRADGENLLLLYHRQNRSAALLGILSLLVDSNWYPSPEVIVAIAWAFLADGQPAKAIAWLQTQPDEDSADWLIARAEAEKSSGASNSKAEAQLYLEKALKTLVDEDAETIARRLRVRHDIARLIHFIGRKPDVAIGLYEAIEHEWEAIPYSDLDRAITIRNLAEALMDASRVAEAEKRALQARRLIPHWTHHVVVSELEYLRGRIAIRLRLDREEIIGQFEVCRQKALAKGYMMLVAIVEARMFWLQPTQDSAEFFDDGGWGERAKRLNIFERHAWAARVLIKGHLRAARRLGERGERGKARVELADARRLVDDNPAFDEGSDRERNAALQAGLSIYESDDVKLWNEWKQRYSWSTEFSDDPRKVWELAG